MLKTMLQIAQPLLEKNLLADPLIRLGIKFLLRAKISFEKKDGLELAQARFMRLVNKLQSSPIAIETAKANEQHYELTTEFFQLVLGRYLKYSSGYWKEGVLDLNQAERDMLNVTIERADIGDDQAVLELGCGWGSLSLVMAQQFPHSHFVGVSNSKTQKEYIDQEIHKRGLRNLEIITADVNHFKTWQKFDRVVSVEMFEHMRNYDQLLEKVAGFLKDEGKLFIHIFTHKELAYPYEMNSDLDWIGKYFFSGGMMPSDHLLLYFQDHFKILNHWRVLGVHYQKTADSWLRNMDQHKYKILAILKSVYGHEYKKWWGYWRIFFISCSELWGYRHGQEWFVSHYLFKKR